MKKAEELFKTFEDELKSSRRRVDTARHGWDPHNKSSALSIENDEISVSFILHTIIQ